MKSTFEPSDLRVLRFGMIGVGHLGRAFVAAFLSHGLAPADLLVADKALEDESSDAHREIAKMGLAGSIRSNAEVLASCDVCVLMITPQHLGEMQGLARKQGSVLISTLAGVPLGVVERVLGRPVVRIMPSPPDSIRAGTGLAAVLHDDPFVKGLLSYLGLRVFGLSSDDEMVRYTSGLTLPAMMMLAQDKGLDLDEALAEMSVECPHFAEVRAWAESVVAQVPDTAARRQYVTRMITPGGITDAVVGTIESRGSVLEAWRAGVRRAGELNERVKASLAADE